MKKILIYLSIIFLIYFLFFYESSSEKLRKEEILARQFLQEGKILTFLKTIDGDTKFFDLGYERISRGKTSYEREKDLNLFFSNPEDYFLVNFDRNDISDYYEDKDSNFIVSVFGRDSLFRILCKEDIFSYIEEIRNSRDDLFIYGNAINILYKEYDIETSTDDPYYESENGYKISTSFYPVVNFSCEKLSVFDRRDFSRIKNSIVEAKLSKDQ